MNTSLTGISVLSAIHIHVIIIIEWLQNKLQAATFWIFLVHILFSKKKKEKKKRARPKWVTKSCDGNKGKWCITDRTLSRMNPISMTEGFQASDPLRSIMGCVHLWAIFFLHLYPTVKVLYRPPNHLGSSSSNPPPGFFVKRFSLQNKTSIPLLVQGIYIKHAIKCQKGCTKIIPSLMWNWNFPS